MWKKWFGATTAFGVELSASMTVVWDVWWLITKPAVKGKTASYLAMAAVSRAGRPRAQEALRTSKPTVVKVDTGWHQGSFVDFSVQCMGTMGWKNWDHLFAAWKYRKMNHNPSGFFFFNRIFNYFTQLLRNFMFYHGIIIYIPFCEKNESSISYMTESMEY